MLAAALCVSVGAAQADDPNDHPANDSARQPASASADAPNALAARLAALEEQVLQLRGRVAALEGRGPSGIAAVATAATPTDDGLVWQFGPVASGSPLAVTERDLNRTTGRLDLLVEVTAPLARPKDWTAIGALVPLWLEVRGADGEAAKLQLRLARGSRTDPGARLHLTAELDPALAAGARQLIVGASQE